MVCQYFPEIRPTQVEAPAEIAEWQDDAGRRAGGQRDVDASIHTIERDDAGWVLRDVEAARQKGFWTLECRGVAAGTMHQPGDPFLYGHATNNRVVFTCLGRSRISHHGIPLDRSDMVVSDVTSGQMAWHHKSLTAS